MHIDCSLCDLRAVLFSVPHSDIIPDSARECDEIVFCRVTIALNSFSISLSVLARSPSNFCSSKKSKPVRDSAPGLPP